LDTDLTAIKWCQREAWNHDLPHQFGATTVIVAELLCEAVGLHAGERVLDIATGTGSAALAAARRCCSVVGIDFAPAMLARARCRATAEQLDVVFREADAEDLPFPDESFDVVISCFGVMFAPDQRQAARELVRVCRRGGRVGLASWTPEGFYGAIYRAFATVVPPPPQLLPPTEWGRPAHVATLFNGALGRLRCRRRTLLVRHRSAAFQVYFEHQLAQLMGLERRQQVWLATELRTLLRRFNRADDGTLLAPADYLEVVATRRPLD